MKNINNDEMVRSCRASALRDATMNMIQEGVQTWLRGGKNGDVPVQLDMWEMVTTDAFNLGEVIALIEQNEVSRAFERAGELDTAVRDEIPKDVWNWMALVRQEEHNEHWARLDDGQKYNL
tara:strand:- start:920 stop:1282 length:363 start_codon:yes stop_codon:yes gene_type:complete